MYKRINYTMHEQYVQKNKAYKKYLQMAYLK
jgi:hypothetical protein